MSPRVVDFPTEISGRKCTRDSYEKEIWELRDKKLLG